MHACFICMKLSEPWGLYNRKSIRYFKVAATVTNNSQQECIRSKYGGVNPSVFTLHALLQPAIGHDT